MIIKNELLQKIISDFIDETYKDKYEILIKTPTKIRFMILDEELYNKYKSNKEQFSQSFNKEFDEKFMDFIIKNLEKYVGNNYNNEEVITTSFITVQLDDSNDKYLIVEINF